MPSVNRAQLPAKALLQRYVESGAYTDCYATVIAQPVSQQAYIHAFYTTLPFRAERLILKLAVKRPSTEEHVVELASAKRDTFAAWTVEDRRDDQLLLCDYMQRTRSWLMTEPMDDGTATRLYFGSAVIPERRDDDGSSTLGQPYSLLLGFHRLYSRILLSSARSRLRRLAARAAIQAKG